MAENYEIYGSSFIGDQACNELINAYKLIIKLIWHCFNDD